MKLKIFIIWLVLILFLGTCGLLSKNNPNEQNNRDIQGIYSTYCSGCHGNQLQRFKRTKLYENKSLADLSQIIKHGDQQKGMPSFKALLKDEDIQKLSRYIKNYNYQKNHVQETKKEAKSYSVEVIVNNLEIPWGMAFLPNGDLLITEKKGVLSLFSKTGQLTEIQGLPPIRSQGQGGLMDIKRHPNYEDNGWGLFIL